MQSGTFNFWIDRQTHPAVFAHGAGRHWATFPLGEESCVVCSEGPMLTAALHRAASVRPLFRVPFAPALDRRHLVTIGWRKGRVKVLLDAQLLAEVPIELPGKTSATQSVPLSGATLPSLLLGSLLAMFPSLAHVHAGARHTGGLLHGFAHPFGGLDHLCAMLAVGLWAAQRGGRAAWLVPLTFVGVMALGGFLGVAGVSLPLVEAGIVGSLLVFGVLIAAAVRLPLAASTVLVGAFALFHGHAHGAEMPANTSGLAYGLGFVLATALLHAFGYAFAHGVRRVEPLPVVRYAGAAIALCGVYLALAA
jgi:urease accessory protein